MAPIPKKVHLIWLGDKSKFKFDLESLDKFMPNYEVKVWGMNDFDWDELEKIHYVRAMKKSQSWAFLSDYLRAKILYEEGGVYLDCDMKLLKNMEGAFSGRNLVLAFENTTTISMGICGAKPGHKFFRDLKSIYESFKGGRPIMGNVIWDHVAKREMNIKINGRYQEDIKWVIYEFRRFSLMYPRCRTWKRDYQYALHQHKVSWVPHKFQIMFKFLIAFTQKITIVNRLYGLVLIWPKKEMKKNYKIKKKK